MGRVNNGIAYLNLNVKRQHTINNKVKGITIKILNFEQEGKLGSLSACAL